MARIVNAETREMVKRLEGFPKRVYLDPVGVPTGGYGHTGPDLPPVGTLVSQAQADAWLDEDLAEAASIVERAVTSPLNDDQFGSLTSFVLNVGPGKKGVKDGFVTLKSGKPSTMLRKLNAGDYEGAQAEFAKWVNGNGKLLRGLVTRRAAEAAMFGRGAFAASANVVPDAPMTPIHPAAKIGIGGLSIAGALEVANQATPALQAIGNLPLWLGATIVVIAIGVGLFIWKPWK